NLFSVGKNELLFYYAALDAVKENNDGKKIALLNNILNELSQRLKANGIQLIVLPCPDKYDVYYDYIFDKRYPKPLFFDYLNRMDKDYLYINSKAILTEAIKFQKDIYFFDDTYWSPWASKLISEKISRLCK
ncbi:MAG TPA: hypothetical protein ENO27_01425, partial [Caldithrix sp.]|nr:hypothetical protein [Caldithrix sp.]